MHQAIADLAQLLVQAGAVPGEDFSCDGMEQTFHLSERGYALLVEAHPDVNWAEVFGAPHAHVDAVVADLHQRLGCPFVDNLVTTMAQRLPQLADADAIGYVYSLLTGVEAATTLALYPFLAPRLDLAAQVRLEWLLRQPWSGEAPAIWLQDLVRAAGSAPADCRLDGNDVLLTEAAWHRLHQVWQGDWEMLPISAHQVQVP
jgi:hypothetical protein